MPSFVNICRISANSAWTKLPLNGLRSYRTTAAQYAAHNFTMPALSPTMTEGSISKWNVKEGQSFSAGDVLLEIETDKATMDVEAQDDGVLVKITQADGSKGVQVGTRIAVMAEAGDDPSSVEIPADEPTTTPSQDSTTPTESSSQVASASTPSPSSTPSSTTSTSKSSASSSSSTQTVVYPLLPSVGLLAHKYGLDENALSRIIPTGPRGQLLKGDILAHVGAIEGARPEEISARFEKLGHLDLSNIKIAPPKKPETKSTGQKTQVEAAAATTDISTTTEVKISFQLGKIREAQETLQTHLQAHLPLSKFVARASQIANRGLPRSPSPPNPTADELFYQLVGKPSSIKSGSFARQGSYVPTLSSPTPSSVLAQRAPRPPATMDLISLLGSPSPTAAAKKASTGPSTGTSSSSAPNVGAPLPELRLQVPVAEAKRATVFLERVKTILENNPGSLVV